MAAGNRSVLVVVNSARPVDRRRADLTIFAALDHFGVAYEVFECADYWTPPPNHFSPRALTILAHDGVTSALTEAASVAIVNGVQSGAGLVCFDREFHLSDSPVKDLLPETRITQTVSSLFVITEEHFITVGHDAGEEVPLLGELSCRVLDHKEKSWIPLATDTHGNPIVVCGHSGSGRIAVFGTGDSLYDESVLGHTRGMDGFMWRSIVWTAQKPFPMRCMPPYVSARFDDCNGTHSSFGYVRVLNRHGIRPNIGLFTDELGPTDWASAGELHAQHRADFSMHAFRDDLYKKSEAWRPFAVSRDKPDLSGGGRHVAFEGLSMDHSTGNDLDAGTIRTNILRMDAQFKGAGITHSRVLNAHFGEVANGVIPYLLERNVTYPCNNSVLGQLYGHQPVWRPGPYALRGTNGRYGVIISRCREHPDMTNVGFSYSHLGATHMVTDILHGNVPFLNEAPCLKLNEAVERGARNIRYGLDALACGKLFTHEQRVHVIDLADWETIVERIMGLVAPLETIGESRETVSTVAECLLDTRLAHAHVNEGSLCCTITGRAPAESPLSIWENKDRGCVRRQCSVPPFNGYSEFRC